ncbi:hypothetical protein HPB50_028889 [Hyalomma asiaticum]|nr:hypothetical protein HPB50_028889 [Hyalomma asiaticum]
MRVALKTQLDELRQALQNRDTTASRCDPSPRLEAENARSAQDGVVVPRTAEGLGNAQGLGNSICSIDQNVSPATDTPTRKDEESDSRASENGPGRTLPLNTKKRKKTRPKLTSPALSQNAESSQMSPNAVPGPKKPEPRHAFVLGDRNAYRLRHAVSRATKGSRLVKFLTKRDATLQNVMREADAAGDIWSLPEAIIIIHAGLEDIVDNNVPLKELAQQLIGTVAAWKKRAEKHLFVLYGVPELSGEAPLNEKCRQWNDLVKKACTELGLRVEFVRAPHMAPDSRQGWVYDDNTAEEVGQRLGRRLCAFLGFRPAYATQRRPWVDTSGVAPFMAALGQIMLQIAGPKHQVKHMRHPHYVQ